MENRLREFHYSAIAIEEILNFFNLCIRQIVFSSLAFHSPQIEGLVMRSPLSLLLCDIYVQWRNIEEKLFSAYELPLRLVIHSFLLLLIWIFILFFLWSIRLILIFNSLLKSKTILPFLLVFKHISLFSVSAFRKAFANSLILNRKWLISIVFHLLWLICSFQ